MRDISACVAARLAAAAPSVRFDRLEAEALIRHALGEETVFLAGIDSYRAVRIRAWPEFGFIREGS
ncbi:hypothetical protein ABT095_24430 [Kitasatospora sp. NPDC002227]|uniref:hypothetical protein n=1 Tax=Kitasatospora sp. NPDC002227 TaxID=3154773 RepID=UPI00331D82D9